MLRQTPTRPLSVDEVARTARVARSTVYLVFGSRAGLFDALADDLIERARFDRVVQAVAHPDAREHLRGGIRSGVAMFAADRDVRRALFSMAQLDQGTLGGAVRRWEADRAGGMAHLARRLAEQGVLRPDVTVEQAAHPPWSGPLETRLRSDRWSLPQSASIVVSLGYAVGWLGTSVPAIRWSVGDP